MEPVVRKIEPEEGADFWRSVKIPFLEVPGADPDEAEALEQWLAKAELDRAWVVDAGDHFAGNACTYSFDVTLPAPPGQICPTAPMAAVSAVGVHPTHRRRGFLRQLIRAMHDDARERGEAIAGLEASESIIYGRFGYGLASNLALYSIDSRSSAFAVPAPDIDVALVDKDEAAKVLPDIFDRQRRTRAGEINRTRPGYWAQLLADRPGERRGFGARFHAVSDDGYALYRASTDTNVFRGERAAILVEEVRGMTPEVEAGLLRFVFDLDLVGEVTLRRRPLDEPLRWRLADPRQLRTVGVEDRLYVRVLDPAAAFEARGYQGEGRLVLEVVPPAVLEEPDAAPGRWVLEAGPDGASCRRARTGEEPDLRLGLPALGTLFMGGFPATLLAAGGRIDELRPGSLVVADTLLITHPSPRSGTDF
jgi:predicted acetyltransferase